MQGGLGFGAEFRSSIRRQLGNRIKSAPKQIGDYIESQTGYLPFGLGLASASLGFLFPTTPAGSHYDEPTRYTRAIAANA